MSWKSFQQNLKSGFQKFGDKTKQFFTSVKENIQNGAMTTAQYLNLNIKLDLISICERDQSNVPIFALNAAKIIIKNINQQQNIFRLSGDKEQLDKLSKELEKSQNVQYLESIDPILVCQLFKRFYGMMDPMLLETVEENLKSVNNNVMAAVNLLNSLNLHYKFNCMFMLRFLELASQKLGENSVQSLVILMQPVLIKITPQNACDEKIQSALAFLIQYATEIGKISGVNCDNFINQLQTDDQI